MPRYKDPDAVYWTLLAAREAEIIRDALRAANGNVSAAASALGIARNYFHKRMQTLGIEREEFLPGPAPTVEVIDDKPATTDKAHWLYGDAPENP